MGDLIPLTDPLRPSVYVHIPFCRRRCPYCAFVSGVPEGDQVVRYLHALEAEIEARVGELPSGGAHSVYIGGGTPTLPGPTWLRMLLKMLDRHVFGQATVEWSIESLPTCITQEIAETLAASGVNRVTLGIQSLDPSVLSRVGREDQLASLWLAIASLRLAGIQSIGIDLIMGLPGESLAGFRAGLERLLDAGIPHLSAYMLHIEEGTPWAQEREAGHVSESPDWFVRRLYTLLGQRLRRAGYKQYEVSNYALPGFASQHNLGTWEGRDLVGFGLAAVGTFSSQTGVALRRYNTANLENYLAQPLMHQTQEVLHSRERYNERLLLGLRSHVGLPYDCQFARQYGQSADALRLSLDHLAREGLVRPSSGRWLTTVKGRIWLDTILLELFVG